MGHEEEAATLSGAGVEVAEPVEYELGQADGARGLADIELRRGRWDQALANAVKAGERYAAASNALGGAEVNRVLGEVQLRRGQLSEAIADFNRAMRAFQVVQARRPYVRAALGAPEANRRRATPRNS